MPHKKNSANAGCGCIIVPLTLLLSLIELGADGVPVPSFVKIITLCFIIVLELVVLSSTSHSR